MTSLGAMRMQPCDAAVPSDPELAVPWKPTDPLKPIQRATSGLFGAPPGIVSPASDPAHAEFGTFQGGSICIVWTTNCPVGVGNSDEPTATV